MPTLLRAFVRFRPGPNSLPATTMRPLWNGSRPLMQRINVDFPDPEGPQITMRSRCATLRLTSFSTCVAANHLLTPIISTIGRVPESATADAGLPAAGPVALDRAMAAGGVSTCITAPLPAYQ